MACLRHWQSVLFVPPLRERSEFRNRLLRAGLRLCRPAGWGAAAPTLSPNAGDKVGAPTTFFLPTAAREGIYCPTLRGGHFGGGAMATIRDLLINRTIHYVQPDQTVFEAR